MVESVSQQGKKKHSLFYKEHFKAVLFRRWVMIKRSVKTCILSSLATVFFSALAIVCYYLMVSMMRSDTEPYTFKVYRMKSDHAITVGPKNNVEYGKLKEALKDTFIQDKGVEPIMHDFSDIDEANKFTYDNSLKKDDEKIPFINLGVAYNGIYEKVILPDIPAMPPGGGSGGAMPPVPGEGGVPVIPPGGGGGAMPPVPGEGGVPVIPPGGGSGGAMPPVPGEGGVPVIPPGGGGGAMPPIPGMKIEEGFNITILYNGTQKKDIKITRINILRIMWKSIFGKDKDFKVSLIRMFLKIQEMAFAQLGPMLITAGLCSIIPLVIAQPIIDINGEVRPYMVSCTLTILPYWLATFTVDYIMWIVDVNIVWLLFLACQIQSFIDNAFNMWYGLMLAGPSFILFLYCVSFAFSSPDSASRQAFLIITILLLVPMIVDIVRNFEVAPVWLDFIYGLFPHILVMRVMYIFLSNIGQMAQGLDYYFKDEHGQVYLIMQYVDIVIFSFILYAIEKVRLHIQRKNAMKNFGNYSDFFKEQKAKHPVTQEAHDMEDKVHNSDTKWAVKVDNVSRLFFNTAGDPIPAVNCVTLGVKEGSLFGFLGANGAGKTTLIKMITSLLPVSDGKIEILGHDITEYNDPTVLSICPQFNTHLCEEMTPTEHFKLYGMLFRMDKEEAKKKGDELIKLLELEDIKDKPLRDISAGNVRKLAIALCFFGPAKIILLDEPTASLDPVARRHVHEMISSFKGEKTFMLCTHLLSEAETLCDEISIMIKGNVYTCGSPQYLSSRFGTEYKIDIELKDESDETGDKVDMFFQTKLPDAELTIMRPKARIYSIPATSITLPKLFQIMQEGKNGENGFDYFTCSSSSLERVFMEIVHMSECGDDIMFNNTVARKDEYATNPQAEVNEQPKSNEEQVEEKSVSSYSSQSSTSSVSSLDKDDDDDENIAP